MKAANDIKRGHGLLFDVLIAIIIFGSIGAGLYFTLKPKTSKIVQVEYRVVFETVEKSIASNISPNEEFLSEEGEPMGIIIKALNDNKVFQTVDRTSGKGAYKNNVSSEFNTVKATIKATAVYEDGSYYVGGQQLRMGEELVLRLTDFYGVATVTDITVNTEGG